MRERINVCGYESKTAHTIWVCVHNLNIYQEYWRVQTLYIRIHATFYPEKETSIHSQEHNEKHLEKKHTQDHRLSYDVFNIYVPTTHLSLHSDMKTHFTNFLDTTHSYTPMPMTYSCVK